ncbi:helix-turn-helix transcriptional regulator [Gulosibacter sp. 10]|uniref:helix-turn-helix domain-containing protein n=1 Tax=Gulosibacter sp. 10 TaxID=1255570 RepID=UPI001595F188|nr:helix-turn-helix transcriptional regulator [Gulosibacter sp. 10]
MTYLNWLSARTDGASLRDIAARAGVTQSTLSRQISGASTLDAGLVIKVARAYGLNVLEALVASGFVTEEEAGAPGVASALERATDTELAREILRRAEESERMREPVSTLADGPEGEVIEADERFSSTSRALPELGYVAGTDDSEEELDRE